MLRDYRLYCFDGGSRIISAEWICALNDAAALNKANRLDCYRVEVWERDRLVGRCEPPRSRH